MKRAFSLVELSIVLVILGLLVGGILAGQSLIRAAELRAVVTERDRYTTAFQSFRDKYFALAGDMSNAYSFWGVASGCTNAAVSTAPSPGETGCNGNGDGRIYNSFGEGVRAWWMLQQAGLIEGNFGAGVLAIANRPGTEVPRGRMSNSGWSIQTSVFTNAPMGWGSYGTDATWLMFGSLSAGNPTINIILKPEEAWNVDTKTDDGKPGSGKTLGGDAYIGSGNFANRCVDARSATGNYDLANTGITCTMAFGF